VKVVEERIFEYRIWQQIDIDDMQFGFKAIFIVRQIQEKFRAKGQKLYFGYLVKAFDEVPREVIRWAVHKLGVKMVCVGSYVFVHRCNNSCKNSL